MSKTIAIFSVASILIVLVIIVALSFIYLQKDGSDTESDIRHYVDMYVIGNIEANSNIFYDGNIYITYDDNGTEKFIEQGILKSNAYIPYRVPLESNVIFRCWGKNNYLTKGIRLYSDNEIDDYYAKIEGLNLSETDYRYNMTFSCTAPQIGRLALNKKYGDISLTYNKVVFNLTSQGGQYRRLGVCYRYTAGILDVTTSNQWKVCEYGTWLNYSRYYPENRTYDYYPESMYRCGEDDIELCSSVEHNKCRLPDMKKPNRFANLVDSCIYTGLNLKKDESIELEFAIETFPVKTRYDYVTFYFFDHDRRLVGDEWVWVSENITGDIAGLDVNYTIKYEVT